MAGHAYMNERQQALFNALARCGTLIFSSDGDGVDANIVGEFAVRRRGGEDRLDMGDGASHVHIDWHRLTRVTMGSYGGEGLLTFFHGPRQAFKLYRPAGPFPSEIEALFGDLA